MFIFLFIFFRGISEAPENGSETAEVSNVVRDVLQHSENSSFTQPLKTNPPVSSVETVSPEPGQVVQLHA